MNINLSPKFPNWLGSAGKSVAKGSHLSVWSYRAPPLGKGDPVLGQEDPVGGDPAVLGEDASLLPSEDRLEDPEMGDEGPVLEEQDPQRVEEGPLLGKKGPASGKGEGPVLVKEESFHVKLVVLGEQEGPL